MRSRHRSTIEVGVIIFEICRHDVDSRGRYVDPDPVAGKIGFEIAGVCRRDGDNVGSGAEVWSVLVIIVAGRRNDYHTMGRVGGVIDGGGKATVVRRTPGAIDGSGPLIGRVVERSEE